MRAIKIALDGFINVTVIASIAFVYFQIVNKKMAAWSATPQIRHLEMSQGLCQVLYIVSQYQKLLVYTIELRFKKVCWPNPLHSAKYEIEGRPSCFEILRVSQIYLHLFWLRVSKTFLKRSNIIIALHTVNASLIAFEKKAMPRNSYLLFMQWALQLWDQRTVFFSTRSVCRSIAIIQISEIKTKEALKPTNTILP